MDGIANVYRLDVVISDVEWIGSRSPCNRKRWFCAEKIPAKSAKTEY